MTNLDPAIALIKKFEGCDLHAYQDVVGVWTIGWGTTEGVKPGQTITQGEADAFLLRDVNVLVPQIQAVCSVSNNGLCALLSFCYNLGFTAFYHSTLLRLLQGRWPLHDITAEFLKWNHAGGRPIEGLTRRRMAEASLFATPDLA